MQVVSVDDLSFSFGGPQGSPVLDGLSLRLNAGETVALTGPSGSGKTTLLAILGLLLRHDRGRYTLQGRPTESFSQREIDRLHGDVIGFVFQEHRLVPYLSAWENVALPLRLRAAPYRQRREAAERLLETVGLGDLATRAPDQLSTGQRQRVAIARALVCAPRLVLADEPTASLDSAAKVSCIALLRCAADAGAAVLVATHDPAVAAAADRRIALER
ncbi:ABC transporter ATP-binding protein [Salinarimonas sp.]|uniref:ABC transporter ATP-binding protein n=1 Tax=Salinarimonas sp. TaxID=2766526 RepID=UPI0032D978D7